MIAAALRIIRLRNLVRARSTETLLRMSEWLADLPFGVMRTLRGMVIEELQMRVAAAYLAELTRETNRRDAWACSMVGTVN